MQRLIVKHLAGSHAYGTATETSDLDIRGIFCGSREQMTTPFFPIREQTGEGEDEKYYEVANYLRLYMEGNPNILESLWVHPTDVQVCDFPYFWMVAYREKLLSKKVAFTFSGYAISQLKRIKGHNKWINNPQPVEKPKHKQFVKLLQWFGSVPVMPRDFDVNLLARESLGLVHYSGDIFGVVRSDTAAKVFTESGDFNISAKQQPVDERSRETPLAILKYNREEYKLACDNHHNYWQWKNNRNETRSALEGNFGYDTKHAMHLVRLLRMGEEILTTGEVIVRRPDAKELLDIRNGLWEYDDLVAWAEEKDTLVRGKLYEQSKLPRVPDIHRAAVLLTEIQDYYWRNNG